MLVYGLPIVGDILDAAALPSFIVFAFVFRVRVAERIIAVTAARGLRFLCRLQTTASKVGFLRVDDADFDHAVRGT
ncbi:MAG TPA: hypothetical protein VNE63_21190 [Candidatus Acidoferrales bacterium]|nr:hypothetical protein [Candidatus Acidoferrales bacterium]